MEDEQMETVSNILKELLRSFDITGIASYNQETNSVQSRKRQEVPESPVRLRMEQTRHIKEIKINKVRTMMSTLLITEPFWRK